MILTAPTFAATHTVTVANFSFTPTTIAATTGDTIMWVWSSGSHTTTSLSVPTGASTWDEMINTSSTTYSYVIDEPGTYTYECSFHPSMQGTIVATTSGIDPLAAS